jgi:effector-binding domain-containing protein
MDYTFEKTQLASGPGIAIRETHRIAELPAFFAGAFTELDTAAKAAGAQIAGRPFARYFSVASDAVDVEAVFPLTAPVVDAGRIHVIDLEGGPAVQTLHVGSYDGLHGAYAALERWLQDQGATPGGPVREVYLTGPDVPQDQQQTLIVQAVAAG